ncbi:Tigger transposable element-derived protein 6, partial [Dictyocoela muelleri]
KIDLLFCVSMTEEKMNPVVVGRTSKKSFPFKSKNINNLNLIYRNNSKAWMTLSIFNERLSSLNESIKYDNRKILLILEYATVHTIDSDYTNVEIIFFPSMLHL